YPPNPIRALDGSLNATQASGQSIFLNSPIDASVLQCAFCHRTAIGTDGFSSFEGEPQEFKIAHLRNLYQKVGMFGVPPGAQAPGRHGAGSTSRARDSSRATARASLCSPRQPCAGRLRPPATS